MPEDFSLGLRLSKSLLAEILVKLARAFAAVLSVVACLITSKLRFLL